MLYLICFNNPYHHSRHYLGYCRKGRLDERIAEHRQGIGARLLQVINEVGIGWDVVRTWPDGDRKQERRMKDRRNLPEYCPHCKHRKNAESRARRRKRIDILTTIGS